MNSEPLHSILATSMRQPTLRIEVVEVNLIVAETFESFFADNEVPPAALAPVFVATLPPDYTSSYDPVK